MKVERDENAYKHEDDVDFSCCWNLGTILKNLEKD